MRMRRMRAEFARRVGWFARCTGVGRLRGWYVSNSMRGMLAQRQRSTWHEHFSACVSCFGRSLCLSGANGETLFLRRAWRTVPLFLFGLSVPIARSSLGSLGPRSAGVVSATAQAPCGARLSWEHGMAILSTVTDSAGLSSAQSCNLRGRVRGVQSSVLYKGEGTWCARVCSGMGQHGLSKLTIHSYKRRWAHSTHTGRRARTRMYHTRRTPAPSYELSFSILLVS
jgi:hypothetical protein